jgi:hypothetical protein
MSRGALLLRYVAQDRELSYIPVMGATRPGQRPVFSADSCDRLPLFIGGKMVVVRNEARRRGSISQTSWKTKSKTPKPRQPYLVTSLSVPNSSGYFAPGETNVFTGPLGSSRAALGRLGHPQSLHRQQERANFESHTSISQTVAPNGLPSLLPRRNFICPHFEGSEVVFAKRRRERHVCCVASARH